MSKKWIDLSHKTSSLYSISNSVFAQLLPCSLHLQWNSLLLSRHYKLLCFSLLSDVVEEILFLERRNRLSICWLSSFVRYFVNWTPSRIWHISAISRANCDFPSFDIQLSRLLSELSANWVPRCCCCSRYHPYFVGFGHLEKIPPFSGYLNLKWILIVDCPTAFEALGLYCHLKTPHEVVSNDSSRNNCSLNTK